MFWGFKAEHLRLISELWSDMNLCVNDFSLKKKKRFLYNLLPVMYFSTHSLSVSVMKYNDNSQIQSVVKLPNSSHQWFIDCQKLSIVVCKVQSSITQLMSFLS